MNPLTDKQIRASFVNASRRETTDATLPDLTELDWDRLDYLGWTDRRAPLAAYVVLELDGAPTGVLLRASAAPASGRRRTALCTWCQDVTTVRASLYVARRGGAAGREGNSLGILVCEDFSCSANARRRPTAVEAGSAVDEVRDALVADRIAGLRERSAAFVQQVAATR
ncbi:FBP domain-containing protein [Modestobacter sp. NPDC049651]|uniref:FBP domain-containing protein n=1 Tax=unclassified Modestobacter TaxID=2643866 RepID=UPI0033E246EB